MAGEVGAVKGREEVSRTKKRRRRSSAENALVAYGDLSVLNTGFGDPPLVSLEGSEWYLH